MQPPTDVIGVKAFLDVLNETLGFAFPSVTIEGEVSSYKLNQNKWVFFDLKDADATLPCFMPAYLLKVPIEDGMKIRVRGLPKVTTWGKFSFTVRTVELAGEGALKRAYELLKAKLQAEGLFEPERKRALPRFPRRIGLVTSGQSAAYADFIKILNSRWSGVEVQLADVQVQGAVAPEQIVGAIGYLNQLAAPVDVLVVIRGGGSLEDLQAFNSEMVARAVAASRTPTIVGVGHEVDTSLADLAADRRAATPTDAARMVVPDRGQVGGEIQHHQQRLTSSVQRQVLSRRHQLIHQVNVLERFMHLPRTHVNELIHRLHTTSHQHLVAYNQRLTGLRRLLASYDPTATLNRGYAIVRHGEQVVTRPQQVSTGDPLMVQLAAGTIKTTVDDGR